MLEAPSIDETGKQLLSEEINYLFGPELGDVVSMAQAAVLSAAPGIKFATGSNGSTVTATTGHITDTFGL